MLQSDFTYNSYQIALVPISKYSGLASDWQMLQSKASCSYFLSWAWMGNWLKLVSNKLKLRILQISLDGRIVGLAVFSEEVVKRRGFVRSRMLILNSTLAHGLNMIVEKNNIVVEKGMEEDVWSAVCCWFERSDFGELYSQFMDEKIAAMLRAKLQCKVELINQTPSYYINLDKIRNYGGGYIGVLSRNTRSQLRSSIRKYEKFGAVTCIQASSIDEAHRFMDGLKELHQRYWRSKGEAGIFQNKYWEDFHRALIDERFSYGEIQLMKITAGEAVVGYIYSLVKDRTVNMIQSGFNYQLDLKAKPGYVCHAKVIEFNILAGNTIYDFLAGDSQYKNSLSTFREEQWNIALQNNKLIYWIENKLVKLVRMLRR